MKLGFYVSCSAKRENCILYFIQQVIVTTLFSYFLSHLQKDILQTFLKATMVVLGISESISGWILLFLKFAFDSLQSRPKNRSCVFKSPRRCEPLPCKRYSPGMGKSLTFLSFGTEKFSPCHDTIFFIKENKVKSTVHPRDRELKRFFKF